MMNILTMRSPAIKLKIIFTEKKGISIVAASAMPINKIVENTWNQLLLLISLAKGLVAKMSSLPDNMVVF
jgi:hypothetical protein